jgi:hypothetical protein
MIRRFFNEHPRFIRWLGIAGMLLLIWQTIQGVMTGDFYGWWPFK